MSLSQKCNEIPAGGRYMSLLHHVYYLQIGHLTAKGSENWPILKRKGSSSKHHFSGAIWMFPKNRGPLKSSILIGFSIINRPFWGTTIFWKHPYETSGGVSPVVVTEVASLSLIPSF